jgi:hypothetical protein
MSTSGVQGSRPLTDRLLAAYLSTEVVDLRGAVWSGSGALALDRDVWVITAENPWSEPQEAADNAAAMVSLEQTLRAAGHQPERLVGRAPDRSWSEDCFAVDAAADGRVDSHAVLADEVLAWGRALGQHAVFLLSATTHAVIRCATGETLAQRPRVLP